MIINTEDEQYIVITLEEYKNLLLAYAQYCLLVQPKDKEPKDKEPQKEKIGFK